ncbi:hypothetical protein KQI84_00930 [bacterium]|nr:hypothetical protein [bacterium]
MKTSDPQSSSRTSASRSGGSAPERPVFEEQAPWVTGLILFASLLLALPAFLQVVGWIEKIWLNPTDWR